MSLSGSILIAASAPSAEAQGGCQSVCMGENASEGACSWCERIEHGVGNGGLAAGSALLLAGLLGAISLGQLCHGLEQGGGIPRADGGGEGGEYTLPDSGTLANFLNSLGFTNADGTPIDANSVSSALDQMTSEQQEGGGGPSKGPYLGGFGTRAAGTEGGEPGADSQRPSIAEGEGPRLTIEGSVPSSAEEGAEPSRAEGETFRPAAPEGGEGPRGPVTQEAHDRWQMLQADAEGRVYDANRNHVLNVDANGSVTDLRGAPVQSVNLADTPGAHVVNGYIDANGNDIRPSFGGGLQRFEPSADGRGGTYHPADLPEPKGPPLPLSDETAARWQTVGAGPNGEMRAPDGSVIGQIGADGTMTTHDGRAISGTSFPDGGRLSWFNTADGQHWAWDEASGGYKPSQMPDGQPFRPLSEAEWSRIDAQRAMQQAPTVAESGHPLPPGEVKPGTEIEGGRGERHFAPEVRDALRAGTKASDQPFTGPEGADGVEGERGSEGVEGDEGPRGTEDAEGSKGAEGAEDGGKTTIREGSEGGESRAADEGGARPAAEGARAGAAEGEGAGARAEEGGGARPSGAEGEAPAVRPSTEPARAEAGEATRTTAADGEGATRPAEDGGAGGLAGGAFNRIMDAHNIQQRYEEHIAAGMSPAEAFSLAVTQTGAGNIASDIVPIPGVSNPLSGAALSSLLPGAMSNVMPDQAVQSWVGTGYGALSALGESIGTSMGAGELDTSAFDRFAEDVANRPGADPFSGYAQVSQLVGEESARADGGNLVSDLQQIYETGAGVDVANEAMSSFQQDVDAGKYGAPLQGVNYLTQAAAEVVADPTTTIGQFVDDVKNIYNYGVGDGFWDESLNQTVGVIKNTPVAAQIYDGYHQVFSGIAEQGVTGFASEMAEGAWALGGETYDAAANSVTNAAGSAYDYVRSWF